MTLYNPVTNEFTPISLLPSQKLCHEFKLVERGYLFCQQPPIYVPTSPVHGETVASIPTAPAMTMKHRNASLPKPRMLDKPRPNRTEKAWRERLKDRARRARVSGVGNGGKKGSDKDDGSENACAASVIIHPVSTRHI